MRKWVNFKVQQFNEDTYTNNELSTIGDYSPQYEMSSLHLYNHKEEPAKDFEYYICALLKREYAKNLATLVEDNKFIYCNSLSDVFFFANYFIKTFSDIYDIYTKPNLADAGDSIKELITCYENIDNKESILPKKDFETLKDFLLKLPSKEKGLIRIKNEYLDQYATYYANALRCFLSALTTIFNINSEQANFDEEIINTDKTRFNKWFDRFEKEYCFETPVIKSEFSTNSTHIQIKAEGFNNIKVHFEDINFYAEHTFKTISDLFLRFNCVKTLEFENCIFNFCFYENLKSLFFKNCVFNNTFDYNAKPYKLVQPNVSVLMFEKCTFNSDVMIEHMQDGMSNTLILKDCRFSENANFRLANITFLKTILENIIFEGKVFFENVRFTFANWNNIFFLTDFKSKSICFPATAKLNQIVLGMKMIKFAYQSVRNFVKTLKDNKLTDIATTLEQFYLKDDKDAKNKDKIDIAIKSDWVSIKQAADILGISYNTLLTMRKEDNASGIIRIPYIGEGKSTKYYFPLLQAYKSGNMKKVNELAKEMEKKS